MYGSAFPPERVQVARELFRQMEEYVHKHDLDWTPVLRSSWLGFQRPGGYYVPVIALSRQRPVNFAVKVPDDPDRLGLTSPYPDLRSWWNSADRQWHWEVEAIDAIPVVAKAIDLARPFQPATGPMPAATVTEAGEAGSVPEPSR